MRALSGHRDLRVAHIFIFRVSGARRRRHVRPGAVVARPQDQIVELIRRAAAAAAPLERRAVENASLQLGRAAVLPAETDVEGTLEALIAVRGNAGAHSDIIPGIA